MRSRNVFCIVALVVFVVPACERITAERIASATGTSEGRTWVVKVLSNPKVALELRADAATALVETGAADRVDAALAGLPPEDRARVLSAIVPRVAPLLDAQDPTTAGEARDAFFAFRLHAAGDGVRSTIDQALFAALGNDLRANRERAGRRSVKEMMAAIGSASLPVVLAVLEEPTAPFAVAVEVIDKMGDVPARDKASAALAKRAGALRPVPVPLLAALATLGGKEGIVFLRHKIEKGTAEEVDAASEALTKARRSPGLVPFALGIATDSNRPSFVRERMVVVLENISGEDAKRGLLDRLSDETDPIFRHRLFQAALKVGRGESVLPALEALPTKSRYTRKELDLALVEPIAQLAFDARAGTFKALESPSPLARMVAIRVLEKIGFGEDTNHLRKLIPDGRSVVGFPPGVTVGREARRVADRIDRKTRAGH